MAKELCKMHNIFKGKNGCKRCNALIESFETFKFNKKDEYVMRNLLASWSILADIGEKLRLSKNPKERMEKLKPFLDWVDKTSEEMRIINIKIENDLTEIYGQELFDNMAVDTITMIAAASGNVDSCKKCLVRKNNIKLLAEGRADEIFGD